MRVVIGPGNRGNEEIMGRYGNQDRNAGIQIVLDFAKRMEMAAVNTFLPKRQEHKMIYKSGGSGHIDYILY